MESSRDEDTSSYLLEKYLYHNAIIPTTMSSSSRTETLAASIHRAVLGGLLAIVAVFAVGWIFRALPAENYVVGVVAVLLAVGTVSWIVHLFVDGYRER
jgi:uncharacterized membrane protein HdeD (DUF308 family)